MGKNPGGIAKAHSRATDLHPIEVGHCNTNNLKNKPVGDAKGSWRPTNKKLSINKRLYNFD
jgi:hypothetical protein